jgi:hypothetical protein
MSRDRVQLFWELLFIFHTLQEYVPYSTFEQVKTAAFHIFPQFIFQNRRRYKNYTVETVSLSNLKWQINYKAVSMGKKDSRGVGISRVTNCNLNSK